MWLYLALFSALFLGLYDVAKKKSLERNGVLQVLLVVTGLSTLILSPCLFIYSGSAADHLKLLLKALIVSTSWISGMVGLKLLPITTVSTMKATRPFLVVLLSIILFGERLNALQWGGVGLAFVSMVLLNSTSRSEGISFKNNKGIAAMLISIVSGVASALYDKHIITGFEPLFVQSWGNLYITILLAICLLWASRKNLAGDKPLKWDWLLLLIAVLITGADALYFFAIKQEGALLSIISILRRCSVIVTFVVGALFFKEKNFARKSLNLLVLLAGMVLLLLGSQ